MVLVTAEFPEKSAVVERNEFTFDKIQIMIAFLGTGLLGSNFTRAFLKRGESVQVWNRSPEKAKALEAHGAKALDNPAAAVSDAGRVHVVLKDDDSVNEVLEKALPGLKPGVVIVDHSTTSPEGAVKRSAAWAAKGFFYLHAPVFMGPQNALESTGVMLVSGDPALIAKVEPELRHMTGQVLHFGSQPGKAASIKLLGNSFLISLTAGLADVLKLAEAMDVPVKQVSSLFESWNPATQLSSRLKRMTEGDLSKPSWELSMARKDAGLMMSQAKKKEKKLNVIPAAAAVMDELIEKGMGNQDWMIFGRDA